MTKETWHEAADFMPQDDELVLGWNGTRLFLCKVVQDSIHLSKRFWVSYYSIGVRKPLDIIQWRRVYPPSKS